MRVLLLLLLAAVSLAGAQNFPVFPKGFHFGSATASYQVEGAYNEDGRGSTIWDTWSHDGRCADNATGDVADDHYHRIVEDIALMKALGVSTYRMSIAWSRIYPTGRPPINPAGIAHYNYEINLLLAANITPHVTLFHWDLPSALEGQYGDGWLTERGANTSDLFAQYADTCFHYFGDRVKNWLTLNEPHTVATVGYLYGTHAPGRCSDRTRCATGDGATEPYIVAHNLLLAHAKAVHVYRTKYQAQQKGRIGIVLDCTYSEPLTNSTADIEAATRAMEFYVGWFADPVWRGDYPNSMKQNAGSRLPTFTSAEKTLLKGSADFFALNHYTSRYASNNPSGGGQGPDSDSHVNSSPYDVNGNLIGPKADSDWLYVVPYGIRKNLFWLKDRYGDLEFWITENGVDVPNENNIPFPNVLHDSFRVSYYSNYLQELSNAINDPHYHINVRGYFAWSLMDNFEWSDGYSKRFGIHYVNYSTQQRFQKDSALYFANLISKNANYHQ